MKTTESTKPMTKPSKTELQKTQPGSDAIGVRAGLDKKLEKQQQQGRTSKSFMQTGGSSQEINNRPTQEHWAKIKTNSGTAETDSNGPSKSQLPLAKTGTGR
jgi:hypothetical protein